MNITHPRKNQKYSRKLHTEKIKPRLLVKNGGDRKKKSVFEKETGVEK